MLFALEDFVGVAEAPSKRVSTARRVLSLIGDHLDVLEIQMLTVGMLLGMDPLLDRQDVLEALLYLSSSNVGALKFTVAIDDEGRYVELDAVDIVKYLETGSLSGIYNSNTGEEVDEASAVVYYFQPSEKFKALNSASVEDGR